MPFFICSCRETNHKLPVKNIRGYEFTAGKSYDEIKDNIASNRKRFSIKYSTINSLNKKECIEEITNFWIKNICKELYSKWQATPWDFNGTTERPNQGAIACGFFVTTILRDMDCKINRHKLSVCASSIMMKSLTPHQRIKNLTHLNYADFNDTLKNLGKGVYIIGLDFHTGFIVNDGKENWFIHSYYVNRRGVIKETVLNSVALHSSKTRWVISLTNDREFMYKWLKG